MTAPSRPIVSRWRIVEADLSDRDHLDLCGPATPVIGANGQGEIAFGAIQAGLDIDYGPDEIGFTRSGFDEMHEVTGSGSAELQEDGSSRSSSSTTTATKPSSRPFQSLLQQPVKQVSKFYRNLQYFAYLLDYVGSSIFCEYVVSDIIPFLSPKIKTVAVLIDDPGRRYVCVMADTPRPTRSVCVLEVFPFRPAA